MATVRSKEEALMTEKVVSMQKVVVMLEVAELQSWL